MICVTGGAGFIGSNFIRQWIGLSDEPVVNLDALTYAGNLRSLKDISSDNLYFIHGDICDKTVVRSLFNEFNPRAVVHFAAESHVDRSVSDPEIFLKTNIMGTFNLLNEAKKFFESQKRPDNFKFLHVSTDEVYGSLSAIDDPFTEKSQFSPNSPYSASKASSDHFARAFHHTYGLPVLITNCSNNYGPYQMPEKLIPLIIQKALNGEKLPVYGDGANVRDWLYVDDHCDAIRLVLESGEVGETYNIGGLNEKTNLNVVHTILSYLEEIKPCAKGSYKDLITFIEDRKGHDRRYAVDINKIQSTLGWTPKENFETGIKKTIDWYLANEDWVNAVCGSAHKSWLASQYKDKK